MSNSKRFIMTSKGIFHEKKPLLVFHQSDRKAQKAMCDVFGEDNLYVRLRSVDLDATFFDLNGSVVGSIKAENMMGSNGALYTINNGQMVENTFERLGKIQHLSNMVCGISHSYKVFRGVIIQDDFTKCRMAIPFERGKCVNINVKELDGQRIVDARYEGGICVVNHGSDSSLLIFRLTVP